jgi:hypothetical protein
MVVPMKLELETYTPSEAEDVTKVAQTTVRNWRRAGYLPKYTGHARYTVADLLVMVAMQALVSRGMAPESATGFAGEIARATFQSLISTPKAYSEASADAARAEIGPVSQERVNEVARALDESRVADLTPEMIEAADNLKTLMDAAEQKFGLSGVKAPSWLVIWANGDLQFFYDEDIDSFFSDTVYDEYVQGPVILFCLGAMAHMVLSRLPRPPVTQAAEGE